MSKPTAKPTIVFVSGACHTEFHINPVIPHFEKAEYRIVPAPLYSAGHLGATFEDDVTKVQAKITSELRNGHNVCVIVHSAGGCVGAEALNRVLAKGENPHDRQTRVIFLASMIDGRPVYEHMVSQDMVDPDREEGFVFAKRTEVSYYNDMDLEDAQPFIDALVPQATYPHPIMSSEKWAELPLLYIFCEQDQTVVPDYQRSVIRAWGMREVSMDCGHCPFVSSPEKFVATIDAALKSWC